ncbi:MAG: hypothetical protein ISS53_05060 [Dehalococcoidia bacterium]|nr:hypothetical protein [Dehalococcoidia bacterium]
MNKIIDDKFNQWVQGKNAIEARISIYERIRDIPYATIPELTDFERYVDILSINKGSCTPKHFLLCNMYQRLGLSVLFAVYPFRWDEIELDYTPRLRKLAEAMPTSHHLACKVDIDGRLVLVDATLDLPLKKLGLTVNEQWDGESDTLLPIEPCGEEQLYHPLEAYSLQAQYDERSLAFYREFNLWLDEIRKTYGN